MNVKLLFFFAGFVLACVFGWWTVKAFSAHLDRQDALMERVVSGSVR
ncbi:hypothetical protein [Burkholderia gladioli]|nr:hypothetical protein [Burkholderia gladioli]